MIPVVGSYSALVAVISAPPFLSRPFTSADTKRCSYPRSLTVTPIDTSPLYPDPNLKSPNQGYALPDPT